MCVVAGIGTHLIAALCLRHRRYKAVPQYNAQQQAVGSINRAAVPRNETAAVLHARSSLQQRGDEVTKRANHLEQQRVVDIGAVNRQPHMR